MAITMTLMRLRILLNLSKRGKSKYPFIRLINYTLIQKQAFLRLIL